jgi:ammonium transporter, Amt family
LATITPASGFVGPGSAIIIGLIAGVVCYLAVLAKATLGYDDALDVVGIHGVGGVLGTLAIGFFASKAFGGADGLFFGSAAQLGPQVIAVLATTIYSLVVTLIILYIIKAVMGLRVTDEEEETGVDTSAHGETAYNL